jgi:hypothetical protein
LDLAERTEYAEHLPGCLVCLHEVGQLAGLPGLLSRVRGATGLDPTGFSPAALDPAPPATGSRPAGVGDPVCAALAEVRRSRARGRAVLAAALVLVALVGVGGTAIVSGVFDRPATGVVAAARLPVAMQPMDGVRAIAALALTDRPWGTEVVMRCRYLGSTEYGPPVYVLVARGADGSTTELARWTAVPNQDIVLSSTTELNRRQLAGLDVRDANGGVVLRTQRWSR